jgi:hypothetical protein
VSAKVLSLQVLYVPKCDEGLDSGVIYYRSFSSKISTETCKPFAMVSYSSSDRRDIVVQMKPANHMEWFPIPLQIGEVSYTVVQIKPENHLGWFPIPLQIGEVSYSSNET